MRAGIYENSPTFAPPPQKKKRGEKNQVYDIGERAPLSRAGSDMGNITRPLCLSNRANVVNLELKLSK